MFFIVNNVSLLFISVKLAGTLNKFGFSEKNVTGEHNSIHEFPIAEDEIILPSLHINLDILKLTVRPLNKYESLLEYISYLK